MNSEKNSSRNPQRNPGKIPEDISGENTERIVEESLMKIKKKMLKVLGRNRRNFTP